MAANGSMKHVLRGCCLLVIVTGFGSPVWCNSISTLSGQVQLFPLPDSLQPGAFESDTTASIFQEQSNITLGADLPVDGDLAGAYTSHASLTPGVIPAGTMVSDLYFDSDPNSSTGIQFTGSITFSSDILGVIALSATLNATDGMLGVAGVNYPETERARGLELNNQDSFIISPDLRTLTFDVITMTGVDQMRIVIAGDSVSTVPEPGSGVLLALGFACVGCLRRTIFRRRNCCR